MNLLFGESTGEMHSSANIKQSKICRHAPDGRRRPSFFDTAEIFFFLQIDFEYLSGPSQG